jgi:hypothetical protein
MHASHCGKGRYCAPPRQLPRMMVPDRRPSGHLQHHRTRQRQPRAWHQVCAPLQHVGIRGDCSTPFALNGTGSALLWGGGHGFAFERPHVGDGGAGEMRVVVIGGGPAGVSAALHAAELGAEVTLIERGRVGGTAFNSGPAPVRTLARAARLVRDWNSWETFGLRGPRPEVDLARHTGQRAAGGRLPP